MRRTYQQYPWVGNMFLWNLNFTVLQAEHGVDPMHEQGSFSIVNRDWSPRPAFYAIQQFIAETRAAQGR
jgi:polysaccharide biosynthesis protein PslG